ncbi:uncharacterized protein LOC129959556 isoform X2 [Argiope bruennichi]|nr:uncharacterized protein LOC129959556 isoform X2 [Argiope bruennichi]
MEIVGGVAMIAGAILTACGHKDVGEFLTKKVSTVSTVTGVATTATSSVTETGLTIKTMNEAKLVLEKDRAYTRLLMQNLQNSKEIDSRLKRIFNCSILSNVFVHVVRLVQEGIVLLQGGCVEIDKLMYELKSKLSKCTNVLDLAAMSETILQNVHATMKRIITNRNAHKAVRNICEIIQRSPLAIEFVKLGLRTTLQICDVLKIDVFTSALGLGLMRSSAGVMATKCLLGSVHVAVSALALISAVKSAQEGTSEHSKMLKEVKQVLITELNTVRKNYSNVP